MLRRSVLALILSLSIALPSLAGAADGVFLDAVKAGDTEAVERYLADGHDPDTRDWAGWTALAWAALLLHDDVVTRLIDAGANIEHVSKGGKNSGTPLMMAAKKYHGLDTVRLLVARGARVDATDQYGRTALWMAARYGRIETVDYLLSEGADPNLHSRIGDTRSALAIARARGHTQVASRLEEAGAMP